MTRFPHINFSFAQSHATNPPSLPSPTFTLPPHRHPPTPPQTVCGLRPGAFPVAQGLGVLHCRSLFHCQPQLFFAEALLRLLLFPQPLCTVCAYGGSVRVEREGERGREREREGESSERARERPCVQHVRMESQCVHAAVCSMCVECVLLL